MMKSRAIVDCALLAGILLAAAAAQAASVTGTVTDKTTGKPAAGDTVVLVEPMSGMSEIGHTTTDARGRYTLSLPGNAPYLVRAMHQGAGYFVSAPQGGGQADISVYDVAPKVDGIIIDEHVIGVESNNGQLSVVERYSVHNSSAPPRTQWTRRTFEVILPDDAAMGDVSAQRPTSTSIPTTMKLEPAGEKGHFTFDFPIQPDENGRGTLFQIQYQLPYSGGKYTFHSVVTLPANTVWVVLPKGMEFTGASFVSAPQDPAMQTFMSRNATPGKAVEFTVSGSGAFPRDAQSADAASGNQPGGGLGAPINTPDPLSKYKWWILGALALGMAGAAAFLLRKPAGSVATPAKDQAASAVPETPAAAKDAALLNALKDELFLLESERVAGSLSAEEYADAKAALEKVLKRALARQKSI